ncbi:MAG TPA: LuxR C-terminal-related transcriptional regulator [Candidatus Limnocylindrales bacterium]
MSIVGRDGELADIHSGVRGLLAGHSTVRAYVGEPGIGKTRMLGELAARAREAGLPVLAARADRPDGVLRLAETAAAQGKSGVVAIVDDVHRLASDHMGTLESLLDLTATPILLALALRPRQLPPPTSAVLCRASMRLDLRQLPPLEFEHTRRIAGDRPDIDVEQLHRDSEGIPLYVHALADSSLASYAPLQAELAALPPDRLAVAQAVAVLGEPFLPETLLTMSILDDDATLAALDGLIAEDVIRTSRPGPAAPTGPTEQPGPMLTFRHRTLATAAYHMTSLTQRRDLHLRADRALERRGAPAIIRARHVANSSDPAHPERYPIMALGARQALNVDPAAANSWLEAVEGLLARDDPRWTATQLLLAKARLNLGRLDDSRAMLLALTGSPEPFVQTDAALHTGRIERYLGRYSEAAALIQTGLTRADSPADRATGLVELSAIAADRADYADSDRLASEAARLAAEAGDQVLEGVALGAAAWARSALGDVDGGSEAVSAGATIVDAMVDGVAVQDIDCLRLIGQSEMLLERLADARRHLGRGVRLARQTGQRHVLPNLMKSLGETEFRIGRLDRAAQVLEEAEQLAAETGVVAIRTLILTLQSQVLVWQQPSALAQRSVAVAERAIAVACGADKALTWQVQAQAALGEALAFAGQPGHAASLLLSIGGGKLLPMVATLRRVRWWELLAITAVAESDLDAADEFATLAVQAVERAPTGLRRGYAFRARALVDGARGASKLASKAAETAAASFAEAGALLELGRTFVVLAKASPDGELERISDRLSMAAALARRCHSGRLAELVDEQQARLTRVTATTANGSRWRAMLTPREHDIALLAGQAMPSNEIAAKLHLSVRTVDSHLGRIYRKLDVPNRVALARLVSDL